MVVEQLEKLLERAPIADGIESTSQELAEFGLRHPLRDGDTFPLDDEVKVQHTAILDLPANRAKSPKKRVQRVFNLEFALVAGIINNALASVATSKHWAFSSTDRLEQFVDRFDALID